MSTSQAQAAVVKSDRFPSQIKYIIGNEACERFSFYGMRTILVVFMTTQLLIPAPQAKATFHLFVSACYLLPLLGGFLADRYLGKYKTILYLSLFYCLGHGVLAMYETRTGLYWGLGLIALGAGGIKPCVSANVGDQFGESNKHLISKVYDWFYWSINFGSFFSTLLTPILLSKFGPRVAFGIPGVLMAIATLVFWMGRKNYIMVPPTGKTGKPGFVAILAYSVMNRSKRKPGQPLLSVARDKYAAEDVEAAIAAGAIFKVFITVSIFWALWDQHGSSWVLQGMDMNLNVFGQKWDPQQMQALNPIMVMLMIPLFSKGLYPTIEKIFRTTFTPLKRMATGMFFAGASFVGAGFIQSALDHGHKLSIAWQTAPYFLLTGAEVMVSITGLEFAYTQAPRSMKSTIMSFWLLTTFAGNLLTAYISKINVFQGATYYHFFAGLMFAVAFIFMYSASRYRVRSYVGQEANARPAGIDPAPANA